MKVNVSKQIREMVKTLLEIKEPLRDSDERLIANIWHQELKNKGGVNITAFEFLQLVSEGKLTSTESIMRSRRKIQEEFEHLRGAKYEARKRNEENIKNQLNK